MTCPSSQPVRCQRSHHLLQTGVSPKAESWTWELSALSSWAMSEGRDPTLPQRRRRASWGRGCAEQHQTPGSPPPSTASAPTRNWTTVSGPSPMLADLSKRWAGPWGLQKVNNPIHESVVLLQSSLSSGQALPGPVLPVHPWGGEKWTAWSSATFHSLPVRAVYWGEVVPRGGGRGTVATRVVPGRAQQTKKGEWR